MSSDYDQFPISFSFISLFKYLAVSPLILNELREFLLPISCPLPTPSGPKSIIWSAFNDSVFAHNYDCITSNQLACLLTKPNVFKLTKPVVGSSNT